MPTKTKPAVAEVPLPPEWPDDRPIVVEEIEDDEVIRAIVPVEQGPTSNSVIVGLGALASMSDEEYEAKKAVMSRGLARVKDLQQSLMSSGEDYGRVAGISKPFLQLPGAEKLANFYGYAVRQEADRVAGDGITTPPLAYHVRSYVHLGSFEGPVVAMGYGEANSWEEKYRWRTAKATCPTCGREGLIRGKKEGPLAGKWWCPGREGGCNSKFEPNATREDGSLLVSPPGKVENTEPYGLAETLIQIAGKRSFVAAIRRATGTSGLFSQDPDSPSVQQQVAETGGNGAGITSEAAPIGITVDVGAKTTEATQVQHAQLARLAKEKGLGGIQIADLLTRLFGIEVEPTGKAATTAVKALDAAQMGKLLQSISTGEVPATEEATPGFPPQSSDEM